MSSHVPINLLRVGDTELTALDTRDQFRQKIARITLDAMVQFVGLLDAHGTVLEINQVALKAVGISLSEVEGKPFWTTFWWQVSDEINVTLRESIVRAAQGEFVRWDTPIYGRAGGKETIIIDASLCPVKDDSGNVVFIVAEGRDITQKKAHEREIAQKNEELQALLLRIKELDEIKTQFFANVSHELRTPLALILGPTERLLDPNRTMTADERLESTQVIARNARLLLKHVNDLLDISKLEANKLRIAPEDLDVAALVRFIASHFDLLAQSKGIRFQVAAAEELIAAVDPAKFQRVLMNLLSNAFKFTPDGGHVRCALRQDDANSLTVAVDDSGPGVKRELRQAVFDRFRQGDGGSDRRFGGTGLGLAIAKEFVELHRGQITLSDSELGGACFQVTLPYERLTGSVSVRPAASESMLAPELIQGFIDELNPVVLKDEQHEGTAPKRDVDTTVLVVEDNVDMNRFITQALSSRYAVHSAFDGREGLEMALSLHPALIVTDIMMPVMSGDEMIEQVRKRPQLDRTPILLLSAKADDELKNHLLAHGAQDFVAKPFLEQELIVRAANLISSRQATLDALQSRQQLEQTVAELQQERELRERFVATLAHDMRNPLTATALTARVLLKKSDDPDLVRDMSRRVINNIERADSMIRDLLDASRIKAGEGIPLTVRECRLDQVVVSALHGFEELQGPRLRMRNDVGEISGYWDDKNFQRVVENLAGNALKYGATHSPVTIGLVVGDRWVELSVHNEGNPITLEDQKTLWEPYRRGTSALCSGQSGWGVGLTLVKGIAEAHGGAVRVESDTGHGTTFFVRLPKDSRTAAVA